MAKEKPVHELKILPEYFNQQLNGNKRFELRRNDREYQVEDVLILNEWDGNEYTGRCLVVEVTYLLDEGFEGIESGFVILGTSESLEEVL